MACAAPSVLVDGAGGAPIRRHASHTQFQPAVTASASRRSPPADTPAVAGLVDDPGGGKTKLCLAGGRGGVAVHGGRLHWSPVRRRGRSDARHRHVGDRRDGGRRWGSTGVDGVNAAPPVCTRPWRRGWTRLGRRDRTPSKRRGERRARTAPRWSGLSLALAPQWRSVDHTAGPDCGRTRRPALRRSHARRLDPAVAPSIPGRSSRQRRGRSSAPVYLNDCPFARDRPVGDACVPYRPWPRGTAVVSSVRRLEGR
jgi:hypothetical protein